MKRKALGRGLRSLIPETPPPAVVRTRPARKEPGSGMLDIDVDRLVSAGFGEDIPIATNDTREGRAANRRVEFRIVEQEGCGP